MKIISYLPYDKHDCDCQSIILAKKNMNNRDYLTCPRKTIGMKKYRIIYKKCRNIVAFVYSTDNKMSDWCDLHYVSEKENGKWKGCFTINLSPIDGKVGFECACGNDTRDFRGNLKYIYKIKECSKGRELGLKNSKFILKEEV